MSETKKHILFLPEWYPNPEDLQLGIFVEKYARAAAQHHNVSLIYCGPFAKSDKIELIHTTHKGFKEFFCFYPKQRNSIKAFSYFIKAHEQCYTKLLQECGKPDLVHLHMLFRNALAYSKIYAKKTPRYVLTEQWSGYLNGNYEKTGFFKKRQYKKAFANAQAITAVSQKLASAISTHFRPKAPIHILPNIAEKTLSTVTKNQNETTILVVADLVDNIKNISGILKAFGHATFTQKTTLIVVGDGDDRLKLEQQAQLVQNASNNKTVLFTGRLPNPQVLDYMQKAHFLITNSFHETFSMVTAEALLAGLPVICTKCGGPEEFVNESNGLLIPVNDTVQLTAALEKMSLTHATYDPQKLSQQVLERFGIEAVATQLNTIYRQILSR